MAVQPDGKLLVAGYFTMLGGGGTGATPRHYIARLAGSPPPASRIIALSGNLVFYNVPVNTTATATMTISNTGNSPLTVSSISYPAGFSGAWSGVIPAGSAQPVTVTFAPMAATSYGHSVLVSSDATSGSGVIGISGTATSTQAPVVIITSPTTNPTYATSNPVLNLIGTASGGATLVTCSNPAWGRPIVGGSTGSWACTVGLVPGVNTVTVTSNVANAIPAVLTVTLTSTSGGDSYEFDDTSAQAKLLTTGAAQAHTFHISGDVDWARFTATAGQPFILTTANLASGVDTTLTLYAPDATTQLAYDDDGGSEFRSSRIAFTPTTSGTYYVKVVPYAGTAQGSYDLMLQTAVPAQLTTPAPGSTLTASTVTFQWTGGTGVSRYWLYVGTTAGGYDLYSADRGTSLSATVAGLPTDGRTVYVRLWSVIGGVWQYLDYTYTAVTAPVSARAQITTPAPTSTLTASTVTFQWTGGTGVTQYWLHVGTTAGGYDVYSADRGTSLSATVATLPTDGRTVYVRLWSVIGGAWLYHDYTYTAVTATGGGAKAQMTTPAPGSTLTASTVTFQWTGGTGVTRYWLHVGTTAGGSDLYSADRGTSLSATVAGLPTGGRTVYVRLWSVIGGVWLYHDYTYTSMPPEPAAQALSVDSMPVR